MKACEKRNPLSVPWTSVCLSLSLSLSLCIPSDTCCSRTVASLASPSLFYSFVFLFSSWWRTLSKADEQVARAQAVAHRIAATKSWRTSTTSCRSMIQILYQIKELCSWKLDFSFLRLLLFLVGLSIRRSFDLFWFGFAFPCRIYLSFSAAFSSFSHASSSTCSFS